MSKERKGFIVYGDIQDVLKELNDDQVAQLFRGMVNYFVDGKAPKFTGILKFVWIPIQQHMDRDTEKYEKKCERNRENIKKRWEREKDTNEYGRIRTNTNDTNKDKDIDKDKDKGRDKDKESAFEADDSLSPENYIFMKGIV